MRLLFILFIFTSFCFAQVKEYKKNDFRLDLKLPHINHLYLNPNKKFKDNQIGFHGWGIGFEYSYGKKHFVETSASFILTFHLPFPIHIDSEYTKTLLSYYFSMTNNCVRNRFTFGYGINYAVNIRSEIYRNLSLEDRPLPENTFYANRNLGITFNSYYRATNSLHIGIIYRPSLINLNNGIRSIYEQLISFELNWKTKLFNFKK
ncbi:hypothetical protein [Capnocytophaga cynodegmi]|uniref:Outer membrane protein beta-barrel domain-containing protein n=1 Tax=Capnocytophaga cynodegmi TaxID=28189 RepID=A0A0B7HF57_9FLAO|nr:hypothetical protein [Capnocytophaga cynodegmi]CEN34162.1 conserved exported hypothetical protein [Capnocytophaga cynodegmi]CEN37880.1 conserved exported hypothetical protein [Capnocytophaga cynodegmi]